MIFDIIVNGKRGTSLPKSMQDSNVYQNWLIDGIHTAVELWIISRPNENVPRCLFSEDWYDHGSPVGPYNLWTMLRRRQHMPHWMENDIMRKYGRNWKNQLNGKVITYNQASELNPFLRLPPNVLD